MPFFFMYCFALNLTEQIIKLTIWIESHESAAVNTLQHLDTFSNCEMYSFYKIVTVLFLGVLGELESRVRKCLNLQLFFIPICIYFTACLARRYGKKKRRHIFFFIIVIIESVKWLKKYLISNAVKLNSLK